MTSRSRKCYKMQLYISILRYSSIQISDFIKNSTNPPPLIMYQHQSFGLRNVFVFLQLTQTFTLKFHPPETSSKTLHRTWHGSVRWSGTETDSCTSDQCGCTGEQEPRAARSRRSHTRSGRVLPRAQGVRWAAWSAGGRDRAGLQLCLLQPTRCCGRNDSGLYYFRTNTRKKLKQNKTNHQTNKQTKNG